MKSALDRSKTTVTGKHFRCVTVQLLSWIIFVAVTAAQGKTESEYPITVTTPEYISKMAVSHDGKHVVMASSSALLVYDAASGEQLQSSKSKSSGSSKVFQFARDNEHLVVSGYSGTFVLKIDVENDYLLSVKKFDVKSATEKTCATAANKPLLLVGTDKKELCLIDYESGKIVKNFSIENLVDGIRSVFLSANGGSALVTGNKGVFLYDLEKETATQYVEVDESTLSGVTFNHDGTRFIWPYSSNLNMFETKTGRLRKNAASSSGNYFIVGSKQVIVRTNHREINFYQPGTMKDLGTIKHEGSDIVAVSPVSDIFAYRSGSKEFKIDRVPDAE